MPIRKIAFVTDHCRPVTLASLYAIDDYLIFADNSKLLEKRRA